MMSMMQAMHEQGSSIASVVQHIVDQLQQATDALQKVALRASAKRVVIRGKDGRPAQIQLVGEDGTVLDSSRIMRGPDGKLIGSEPEQMQ
jgi:predicted RNA-binding protein Jag